MFQPASLNIFLVFVCGLGNQSSVLAQEADKAQSKVHGVVINSVTHEPVGRALVYSWDDRFATVTDSEGHFEFAWSSGVAGMVSSLTARKPSFLDDPNERRQVEPSPGSEVTIPLVPEGLIKGRVILSTSEAAAGVSVQIFSRQVQNGVARWVQGVATRANSNGEFRFAELRAGDYKLFTHEYMDNDPAVSVPGGQSYGFPPIYYPNGTNFGAGSTIQLRAGQTFQADLSLARQPYYPVRIPVMNAEGNGVGVTVSPQGHRGPGFALGYNAGKHSIEGSLPNGNYLVEAASYGQSPTSGKGNLTVAGAPVEVPGILMARDASVTLNVKEEFSSTEWNGTASWSSGSRVVNFRHGPRTYLQVNLEAADDFEQNQGGGLREPTGPGDDAMVLENVHPGRYWLRLGSSRGYVASATMGGVDLLHQPLVVGAGTEAIDITMRDDTAELDGTVAGVSLTKAGTQGFGVASNPAADRSPAYVYCVPLADSPGQMVEFGVAADGTFNSLRMAPGTYRVMAFKNQQESFAYRDAEAMRAYETKGQTVHLSPGEKANVELQVLPSSE